MLRSWRVSERWWPVAPVRRVEPLRDDEPAEREWIRYMPFEIRSSQRKEEAVSYTADFTAASMYNKAGRIRNLDLLEVGSNMDYEV